MAAECLQMSIKLFAQFVFCPTFILQHRFHFSLYWFFLSSLFFAHHSFSYLWSIADMHTQMTCLYIAIKPAKWFRMAPKHVTQFIWILHDKTSRQNTLSLTQILHCKIHLSEKFNAFLSWISCFIQNLISSEIRWTVWNGSYINRFAKTEGENRCEQFLRLEKNNSSLHENINWLTELLMIYEFPIKRQKCSLVFFRFQSHK